MSTLARTVRGGVIVTLLLIVLIAAAGAQTIATSVHVTVTDAASGAPIAFARVFVFGARNVSALTGERGEAVIDDLPPGEYRFMVGSRGYASVALREVAVEPGRVVTVAAKLQKAGLRTIGAVAVRSSGGPGTESVSADGEPAAVSDNLLDALRLGSGVSSLSAAGSAFASIDGHSPNDVGIAIDGVPIAPPGSPVSLHVLSPSLFSGLTVDRAGGNGSSALLNFRTADPTIAWQSTFQQTIGARTQAASATIRGSAGYVGVSFSHAVDDVFGPLQGLAYQDQSGVAYPHTDAVTSTGDAVKLRIPFAGQVFGLSAARIESAGARACDRFSAPLPCGYGPHNSETTTLRTFQFRDTAVVGATAISAVLFSAAQTQHDDFSNRMLNGVTYPLDATVRIPTTGFQWTVSAPAGTRHNVSLAGYAVEGRSQSIAGPGQPPQLGDRIAYRTLTLSDSMRLTKALRGTIAVGRQQNAEAASAYALSSLAFDPGAKDRLALRYSAGALSSAAQTFDGVSDPVALQFDCDAPAGFGTGPQRGNGKSTTTSAGFSWLHRLRGDDQLAFSAHRDVVYDGAVTTTIAAADVPAILPPGYADRVDGIFRAVCGTASALPLDRQYLYAGAIGPVLTFGGASIAGRFAVTPKAFVQPYYTVTSAVERGEAPYVSSRSSIVVPGAQLPGVPVHHGGAFVGMAVSKTQQVLLNADYTGANNPQHLPPYWTLNAAYGVHLEYGTLSVIAENLANAYPGPFATEAHAVPLRTRSGGSIATVATPNAPRAVLVRYRVAIGKPPSAMAASDLDAEQNDGDPPSFELLPFSAAPPDEPFTVQTTAESCGPERAALAAKALAIVRNYVASPHGDEEVTQNGTLMAFRKNGSSFSVLIGGRPKVVSALLACAAIHGGRRDAVASLALYAPTRAEAKRFDLAFSPRAGFYVADVIEESETVRITYLPLGDRPPEDPFALRPPSECPSQVRSAAAAMLQRLASATGAASDAALRGAAPWIVSRHGDGNASWLEASLSDPNVFAAVLRCAYLHAGSADVLRARGYGAPGRSAFGYTPALGLFVVAPDSTPH